ncbi:pollen-specific protein C13-like [Wolffia australiana]
MAAKYWTVMGLLAAVCAAVWLPAAEAQSFVVEGRVYCDTCRAGFETTATTYLTGARVRLECKHQDSQELVHTVEGETDETGTYHLSVADDHEDEICEVVLVKSPASECAEIKEGRERAPILLAHNSGLATNVRLANSLGFLREEPLSSCGTILAQYQLGDDNE